MKDDFLYYGTLDRFSAFPFENFLKSLKALIRSATKPLEQICRRIYEYDFATLKIDNKTVTKRWSLEIEHNCFEINHFEKQYKKFQFSNKFTLSINLYSKADCYCFTDNDYIQVENIVVDNQNIFIVGKYFISKSSFYTYPCDSRNLNICALSKLSSKTRMWSVSQIKGKCMLLPYRDNWVAVPLFHSIL